MCGSIQWCNDKLNFFNKGKTEFFNVCPQIWLVCGASEPLDTFWVKWCCYLVNSIISNMKNSHLCGRAVFIIRNQRAHGYMGLTLCE